MTNTQLQARTEYMAQYNKKNEALKAQINQLLEQHTAGLIADEEMTTQLTALMQAQDDLFTTFTVEIHKFDA